MMSYFRGDGGSEMTPKNRILEGKNWTLGGMGGQKSSKIVGHHLWMIPNIVFNCNQTVTIQQWVSKDCYFACRILSAAQSAICDQQWETNYLFKTSPTLIF